MGFHLRGATATRTCRTRADVNRVGCRREGLPTWCTLRGDVRERHGAGGGCSPPRGAPTGG